MKTLKKRGNKSPTKSVTVKSKGKGPEARPV